MSEPPGEALNPSFRSYSPASYVSSSSEDDTTSKDKSEVSRTRIPPVDPSIISELEEQNKYTTKSVEIMLNYLSKTLNEVTAVAEETVQVYDGTVEHVHLEVEKNIHLMYGLIAKCEELDRKMKPVTELANQVHHIKESLDALEQLCK